MEASGTNDGGPKAGESSGRIKGGGDIRTQAWKAAGGTVRAGTLEY